MGQLDTINVIRNPGFLSLSTIGILGQIIFCCRGLSGLYFVGFLEPPLAFTHDMQQHLLYPHYDNQKCFQKLPNILGWAKKKLPPDENHCPIPFPSPTLCKVFIASRNNSVRMFWWHGVHFSLSLTPPKHQGRRKSNLVFITRKWQSWDVTPTLTFVSAPCYSLHNVGMGQCNHLSDESYHVLIFQLVSLPPPRVFKNKNERSASKATSTQLFPN